MKKNIKFEEAVNELEIIIKKLEEHSESIEDVVKLYEEGKQLLKFCNQKLDKIELKIETINKEL